MNRIARLLSLPALGAVVLALAGCAPLASPGKTDQIEFVASSTSGGWKWDHYRNLAYPCSISGYQSLVIGTKVGSSNTATRPLWVRMRGGGVGFFDENGNPQPSAGNKSEETAATSIGYVNDQALTGMVRNDPAGFRIVSVSMCNHDIYSGGDQQDPNNPNTTPDGEPRTVNGMFATKAAIAFAKAQFPTGKVILHGTSAGSYGVFSVGYSLQEEGVPPAGAIADSGVLNRAWEEAKNEEGTCSGGSADDRDIAAIAARLHPGLTRPKNQPDLLIARGDLTVPFLHVWSSADPNVCGGVELNCPLPDGSSGTMGSADCAHEHMRAAIAGLGPGSRSRNLRLCVSPAAAPGSCETHVVTNKELLNTDPAEAPDYLGTIMDWVHTRLGDP